MVPRFTPDAPCQNQRIVEVLIEVPSTLLADLELAILSFAVKVDTFARTVRLGYGYLSDAAQTIPARRTLFPELMLRNEFAHYVQLHWLKQIPNDKSCDWDELFDLKNTFLSLHFQYSTLEASDPKASLVGLLNILSSQIDVCFDILYHASKPFFEIPTLDAEVTESLRYMKFVSLPSECSLRARYRQLARISHPDIANGKTENFIKLKTHYDRLARTLAKR